MPEFVGVIILLAVGIGGYASEWHRRHRPERKRERRPRFGEPFARWIVAAPERRIRMVFTSMSVILGIIAGTTIAVILTSSRSGGGYDRLGYPRPRIPPILPESLRIPLAVVTAVIVTPVFFIVLRRADRDR